MIKTKDMISKNQIRYVGLNTLRNSVSEDSMSKIKNILKPFIEKKLDNPQDLDVFPSVELFKSKYNIECTPTDVLQACKELSLENNWNMNISSMKVTFDTLPF